MKKVLLFLLATLTLASCGINVCSDKGPEITSVRHTRPFTKIVVKGAYDVKFVQADTFGVKVVGKEEHVKSTTSTVVGDVLTISRQKSTLGLDSRLGNNHVTVYVSSPDLVGVELKGAGDFEVDSLLDTDTLNILLKGAGDVKLGKVLCDKLDITLTGAGDIEVKDVTTQYSKITLKGVGDVEVNMTDGGETECMLKGVGDITLRGKAKSLKKRIQGTGSIDTDNLVIAGN